MSPDATVVIVIIPHGMPCFTSQIAPELFIFAVAACLLIFYLLHFARLCSVYTAVRARKRRLRFHMSPDVTVVVFVLPPGMPCFTPQIARERNRFRPRMSFILVHSANNRMITERNLASPLFSLPPAIRMPALGQSPDHRFYPYRDVDAENDHVSDDQSRSLDNYSDDNFSGDASMDASVDVESSNDGIDEKGGNEKSASAPVAKGVALSRITQTLERSSRKKTTFRNYTFIVNDLFAVTLADDEFNRQPLDPVLLRDCLDSPSKKSAQILDCFIRNKCGVQGRGQATANANAALDSGYTRLSKMQSSDFYLPTEACIDQPQSDGEQTETREWAYEKQENDLMGQVTKFHWSSLGTQDQEAGADFVIGQTESPTICPTSVPSRIHSPAPPTTFTSYTVAKIPNSPRLSLRIATQMPEDTNEVLVRGTLEIMTTSDFNAGPKESSRHVLPCSLPSQASTNGEFISQASFLGSSRRRKSIRRVSPTPYTPRTTQKTVECVDPLILSLSSNDTNASSPCSPRAVQAVDVPREPTSVLSPKYFPPIAPLPYTSHWGTDTIRSAQSPTALMTFAPLTPNASRSASPGANDLICNDKRLIGKRFDECLLCRTKSDRFSQPTHRKDMPRSKAASKQTASPAQLQQARAALHEEFGRPQKTRDQYDGYLKRGKQFLAEFVARVRGNQVQFESNYDLSLLVKALDRSPNKYSAKMVLEFVTDECCVKNKGKDTANGIVAAFCDYWDTVDDGRWSGDYHIHGDEVFGCPARAPIVRALVKDIETRDKVQGTRRHAEAIDIYALKTVINWSLALYPSEKLKFLPKDDRERNLALKHARVRAMFVLGFILWTRNSELTAIKRRDIKQGCPSNKPGVPPHSKVRLHHRKGWQRKSGASGIEGIEYELHSGCDIPELDAGRFLKELIDYTELLSGEPMKPDHLLFPYMSRNGAIDVERQLHQDQFQNIINWAAGEAGLTTRYTTHCFRRGGAQYRFIYAPVRWDLDAVRWWGGWAEGESNIETLSKYLLNCEEKNTKNFADQILVGASAKSAPATVEDLQSLGYAISSALNSTKLAEFPMRPSNMPSFYHSFLPTPPFYVSPYSPFSAIQPALVGPPYVFPMDQSKSSHSSVPPASPSSSAADTVSPGVNNATHQTFSRTRIVESSGDMETDLLHLEADPESNLQCDPSEFPESFIPRIIDLPRRGKGVWLKAIEQWTTFDPYNRCALRDWPAKWSQGKNRDKNGMKRRARRVVWEEFQRLGGSEEEFRRCHPYVDNVPFLALVRRIGDKNGTVIPRKKRKK
ncbi:hypothetical protein H0H93_014578 [Arthromyces matolae]|nr:hypothetical protein H0H93_014578 [Arthromyces matolae]